MNIGQFLNNNYKEKNWIAKMYINNPVKKNHTYYVTASNLAVKDYDDEINAYMSMNPICYKNGLINRDLEHVESLKWLYMDLDYYNTEYNKLSQEQVLWLLEQDYFGQSIPMPTYVIDSGRGMYLLWRIDENIKALPRWKKVQRYFCEQLKEFGADPKVASDAARVLRCVGSINSKSNTEVRVMRFYEKKYCISNIVREYLPKETSSVKMVDLAEYIANTLEIELPDMLDKHAVRSFIKNNNEVAKLIGKINKTKKKENTKQNSKGKLYYYGTEYSMLQARLSDLETLLLKYRDQEKGHREYILFLYRYWNLCINEDKSTCLNKTLELNRRLSKPLSEKEVIQATKSAEKYFDQNKCFRLNNANIIKILNITPEEMKDMKTIISKAECLKRKQERNKKAYLERLKSQGKNTKEEDIKNRQRAIYKLINEGKTQKEICEELHISKSTFYTDRKVIECFSDAEKYELIKEESMELSKITDLDTSSPKNSAFVINKTFRSWEFWFELLSVDCDVGFWVGYLFVSYGLEGGSYGSICEKEESA